MRNLLSLAHYRFKLFIKNKAVETGATVLDVNEAYTTKTVSWYWGVAGESWRRIGGRLSRRRAGWTVTTMSRGIYLRALGDIPALRALLSECAASANNSCLSGNMSKTAESVLSEVPRLLNVHQGFLSARYLRRYFSHELARPAMSDSPQREPAEHRVPLASMFLAALTLGLTTTILACSCCDHRAHYNCR